MGKKTYRKKPEKGKPQLNQSGGFLLASWHPYAIVILTGIIIFGRALFFGFTYFDDDLLIINKIDSLTHFSTFFHSFITPYFGPYYRPLVTISLMIDALISHLTPWMYHLSNILFHLTAGCLTYFLLTKMFKSRFSALMGAIIFILHPLATQAIAWIPGRNDSLSSIFILLSIILFIKSLSSEKYYTYLFHILFFCIALFTKESALILPFIALSYYFIIEKAPLRSVKLIKYAVGWGIVIAFWYLLRSIALSGVNLNEATFSINGFSNNFPAFIEMLGKLIFPVNLSVYPTLTTISTLLGIIALTGLIIFLFFRRNNINRTLVFSLLWIFLFMLPGLFVNIADDKNRFCYLECRGYVSIIGFSILIAGITDMYMHYTIRKIIYFVSPFILLFGIAAFSYSSDYSDPLTHWKSAVEMSPKVSDTYFNLGIVSAQVYKDLDFAEQNIKKAIELNNSNSSYHNWLGVIYGQKKMNEPAIKEFNSAIELNPSDPAPYSNLGFLYTLSDSNDAAEKYFRQAILVNPNSSTAYYQLISLYYKEKRYNDALEIISSLQSKGFKVDPSLEKQIKSVQK